MLNQTEIRRDFPFLKQKVHGQPVIFLDSAASAQKPQVVIDTVSEHYAFDYANVHRGVYTLSAKASEKYEQTRKVVQNFIHAENSDEIIFTKGTTESINLVAFSLLQNYFQTGDEIIITEMEHHANIVPWQLIAERKGLKLKYIPINDHGELELDALAKLLNARTKLLAISHCSNVLGTINPIEQIIKSVKAKYDIAVLVDGAQSAVHQAIDVQRLGCDFFAFSSHKLYGPTGVGILYARKKWHDVMTPYQGGGEMINEVTMAKTTFADAPYKFEAGTPNIVGVIGLGAAIQYIRKIGSDNITRHEQDLLEKATQSLKKIPGVTILGKSQNKAAVISFVVDGFHANDLGTLLDLSGVCVRTGQHCAEPLLRHFKVSSAVRASFALYNNEAEINILIDGLKKAIKMLS